MIKLRRKTTKINEDNNQLAQQKLNLLNNKRQIQENFYRAQEEFNRAQEKFNSAKKKRDEDIKKIDDNLLQIEQQLTNGQTDNMQQNVQQSNNTNNSNNATSETTLNEGANVKHDILTKAILLTIKDCDLSYELSITEITRLARKINDFINSHKNETGIIDKLRNMIKNYFLKHNKISLSQSEINSFNNSLEKVLHNKEYEIFKNLFKKSNDKFVLNIDDYLNVDELEAEIDDLGIDIDEDLDNNKLYLSNIDNSLMYDLAVIAKRYNILKLNNKLFSYL